MYIKQALGQIASAQLGKDPKGATLTFSGTKPGEETKSVSDDGGFFDTVGGILKGGVDIFASGERAKGAAAAQEATIAQLSQQRQSQIPGWVLPVALGGGALVLVMVLRRRR